jgi:hypothetical protein
MVSAMNDIETPINDIESLNEIKSILSKPRTPEQNLVTQKTIGFIMYFVLVIVCFPLIFCDYYFAMNNTTCMQQPLHISLTMYDYLIINATFGCFVLLVIFLIFMTVNFNNYDSDSNLIVFLVVSKYICMLFTIAWAALGGIMYWGEMDKSLCSNSTNDYLTTMLIIKYISIAFELNYSMNKK